MCPVCEFDLEEDKNGIPASGKDSKRLLGNLALTRLEVVQEVFVPLRLADAVKVKAFLHNVRELSVFINDHLSWYLTKIRSVDNDPLGAGHVGRDQNGRLKK